MPGRRTVGGAIACTLYIEWLAHRPSKVRSRQTRIDLSYYLSSILLHLLVFFLGRETSRKVSIRKCEYVRESVCSIILPLRIVVVVCLSALVVEFIM